MIGVAGWGQCPTSPQLSAGRVPHVQDKSTDPGVQSGPTASQRPAHPDDFDDVADDALDALAEARRQIGDVPAEVVITNHVMGLYELAAIHLGASPPDLAQAALAIDAVGCLVEGLDDRLGPDAGTMRDALANIRLAFVQIKGASGET